MRRTIIALLFALGGCMAGEPGEPTSPGNVPDPRAPAGSGSSPTTADPFGNPPSPQAAPGGGQTEIDKFAKCMAQADWDSSGMGDLHNQTTVGYGGECYSCHATGMFGTYLSKDSTGTFTRWKTSPWVEKFVTAAVNPDGTFKDIVQTYRFRDRGTEAGHPGYTLSTTRSSALDNFFQLSYAKYKAGNCP